MNGDVATGIMIGLVLGFLLGAYTAIHYRERDIVTVMQKATAVLVGGTWLGMHTYLIFTGGGDLSLLLDVIGSAAIGELLGINLVETVKAVRNKK